MENDQTGKKSMNMKFVAIGVIIIVLAIVAFFTLNKAPPQTSIYNGTHVATTNSTSNTNSSGTSGPNLTAEQSSASNYSNASNNSESGDGAISQQAVPSSP